MMLHLLEMHSDWFLESNSNIPLLLLPGNRKEVKEMRKSDPSSLGQHRPVDPKVEFQTTFLIL